MRIAVLVTGVLLALWTGYTRIVMGVHGINQVWFGFMLGAWFAGMTHFIIKEPMLDFIQKLIDAEETRLWQLGGISFAIFCTIISVQVINYEAVKHFNNPAIWITNLATKCNITNASKAF